MRVTNLGVRLPKGRGASRIWGQHHWALRGINIELMRGETVGILGRNGSGKSTLLRALASIIEIDEGAIDMAPGLTAAILSPGAGFEKNLTGRENLYNSAVYQGFPPKLVKSKINDIIELSGIGDWVDQPVAIYSAGMRARLGLSLALHLPTDILMVDETLSAGDVAFRAKAREIIEELITSDRTVLLVSHNLDTLRSMCSRGIVLDRGHQVAVCGIDEAIDISKAILLAPVTQPGAGSPELSQRELVIEQVEAVQSQLAEWREEAAKHAEVFRLAADAYLAALERVAEAADKLMAAQHPDVGDVAGSTLLAATVDIARDVDGIVEAFRNARQKVQVKRAAYEAAHTEQQRLTKIGDDLRARLTALYDKLAAL